MKHSLSILILLGFVSTTLISCSQPEYYLENCADYNIEKIYKSEIHKYEYKIKKTPIYMSIKKEDCVDTANTICMYYEYLDSYKERINQIKSFDLSDKLKNLEDYEWEFRSCSESFKEDEITFKAKWK